MKTIFILILSVLSVGLFGQSKTTRGDVEPLTTDINSVATRASINATNITLLPVWTFSGDTMIVTQDGVTRKFIPTTSVDVLDQTPPTFVSGDIGARGYDTVYVEFDEELYWASPSTDPWSVNVDGADWGVFSAIAVDDAIKMKLDSAISNSEVVTISYSTAVGSRIQDTALNYMAAFTVGITNTVPQIGVPIGAEIWMKGNNNLTDEQGNYTPSGVGSPTFSTTRMGGSHSMNLGTSASIDLGNVDLGDSSTIMFWWQGDVDPGAGANIAFANRTSSTNNDGVMIWISSWATDNGYIWLYTGNGAAQENIQAGGYLVDNTWAHLAFTLDKGNGRGRIYLNGSRVDTDSTFLTDYATSGNAAVLGAANDNTSPAGGLFDDFRIYQAVLTPEEINTIYNNDEIELNTINPGDSTITPAEDIDMLFTIDIDAHADQRGFSEAELDAIFPNFWFLGSQPTDFVSTLAIVTHDGKKWWRHHHDKNTCCNPGEVVGSNPGSGTDARMRINADYSHQNDGYYSQEVYFPSDYNPGSGAKFMGIQTSEGHPFHCSTFPEPDEGTAIMQMVHVSEPGKVDFQWYAYPHRWYTNTQWGVPYAPNNAPLPPGINFQLDMDQIYEVTVRWYGGTVGQHDGFAECFIDGLLVHSWTGVCWMDDSNKQFDVWSMWSFAGGEDISYYAPWDTYYDTHNHRAWTYPDGTPGVPDHDEPSNPGRIITLPD